LKLKTITTIIFYVLSAPIIIVVLQKTIIP
jgi:hypothetical protein